MSAYYASANWAHRFHLRVSLQSHLEGHLSNSGREFLIPCRVGFTFGLREDSRLDVTTWFSLVTFIRFGTYHEISKGKLEHVFTTPEYVVAVFKNITTYIRVVSFIFNNALDVSRNYMLSPMTAPSLFHATATYGSDDFCCPRGSIGRLIARCHITVVTPTMVEIFFPQPDTYPSTFSTYSSIFYETIVTVVVEVSTELT